MPFDPNPLKWFHTNTRKVTPMATAPVVPVVSAPSAVISPAATVVVAPVVPVAAAVPKHNGFVRFLDAAVRFIVKAEPVAEEIAIEAEPFLAFSPFGPEYVIAVNAVKSAHAAAAAASAAGITMTGKDKFALAQTIGGPALNKILTAKGVSSDQQTHVDNWLQLIFGVLTGPIASAVAAKVAA